MQIKNGLRCNKETMNPGTKNINVIIEQEINPLSNEENRKKLRIKKTTRT